MGYVLKDSNKTVFLTAVRQVAQGKRYLTTEVQDKLLQFLDDSKELGETLPKLTKREKEILPLLMHGDSARIVAAKLFISQTTVETHKRNMIEKYGVVNVIDLVRFAMENKLLDE